jgi:hypothetical protein
MVEYDTDRIGSFLFLESTELPETASDESSECQNIQGMDDVCTIVQTRRRVTYVDLVDRKPSYSLCFEWSLNSKVVERIISKCVHHAVAQRLYSLSTSSSTCPFLLRFRLDSTTPAESRVCPIAILNPFS